MLYSMAGILKKGFKEGYAIPQPDFVNINMAAAYLQAATEMNSPIILGFGEDYIEASGATSLRHLVKVIDALAEGYDIPVVLHLDHGSSYEVCAKAINAGFTSVMIDGSSLSFEENISLTRNVVELASLSGVSVEGELGRLKTGKGYDLKKGETQVLTDPDSAAVFVEKTQVDALAVSIGSVHGEYQGVPDIKLDLLKEIKESTNVPLVLHGASGIPFETLSTCSKSGIAKVNIFTDIAISVNQKVRETFSNEEFVLLPAFINDLKNDVALKLTKYIRALGAENKK